MVASALDKLSAAICIAIAVAVFLAFSPVLRNGFVGYDDGEYVVENVHVNTGLSWPNAVWAFTAAHSSNWHPLTWLSHALDCTLFGLSPAGHHFTSLLLHVANSALLFLWLAGATGSRGRSAFVALVFGLHPLHVESVAWVAERKDVLSTFFGLLALVAYNIYIRRPRVGSYLAVAACLAAGLLAKPMLVTLPLLLLVLDWWPYRRLDRRALLEKLPLLALSVLSGAVTLWAQHQGGAVVSIDQLPLSWRLANAAVSYVRYIGLTLWPAKLAVFYPFPFHGIAPWIVAASLLVLAALSAAAVMLRQSHPWLLAGWCWYLVSLMPVIGIVQVGLQSHADRYLYLPMTGLLIALAWECAARVRAPRLLPAAAAILLAACAVLSWRQIRVWTDGVTLFTHALEVTHDNFLAHDNLGVELDRRGRHDEALGHYREALRIKPGDRNAEANYAQASFARGERLIAAGTLDDALAAFRDGIRYRPGNALAHSEMGGILSRQHRLPAAIAEFRQALRIDPRLSAARMGLGVALAWNGYPVDARQAFEETIRDDPSNLEAHYDLGLVLSSMGQLNAALDAYAAALRLQPGYGPAHAAAAQTLYVMGRYAEASQELAAAEAAHTAIDPDLARKLSAQAPKR